MGREKATPNENKKLDKTPKREKDKTIEKKKKQKKLNLKTKPGSRYKPEKVAYNKGNRKPHTKANLVTGPNQKTTTKETKNKKGQTHKLVQKTENNTFAN